MAGVTGGAGCGAEGKIEMIVVASAPDDRDILYVPQPGPWAPSVDLKPDVFEVENQTYLNTCTMHSVAESCQSLTRESYSILFLDYTTRVLIEGTTSTAGASVRDALRAASHYGLPLETLWPYVESQQNVMPPPAAFADALGRRVKRYEKLPQTTDLLATRNGIKSVLSEGRPVTIAVQLGAQYYGLTGPWQTHRMDILNPTTNPWRLSHSVNIIGYDDASQNYLCEDHRGPVFADGGFFGYSYDALELAVYEMWMIRAFADLYIYPPVPTNHSKARVYLDGGGDTFTAANSGLRVYCGTGDDSVSIERGVTDLRPDANLNTLEVPGVRASYQFMPTLGVGLLVKAGGVVIVTIPSLNVPLRLLFRDGSARLEQTGAYAFTLDGVPL